MSTTTTAGSQTTFTTAASTPNSPSVWTYRLICACVTMWAIRKWGCPTCWTTRPCQKSSSRQAAGCPFWPSGATQAPRSSCVLCLPQCAWTGPSTPVAPCVKQWETVVRRWWRLTASPGPRCWPVTSSPLTTTCASQCSSLWTLPHSHRVGHSLTQWFEYTRSSFCKWIYLLLRKYSWHDRLKCKAQSNVKGNTCQPQQITV